MAVVTREAVTVAGTGETNEAASEEVTVPGLSAAAHRLTDYSQLWSCGGRRRASNERCVITPLLLSVDAAADSILHCK